MAEVVIIGAGVGGLCAAIRLAAAGHRVTVLERNAEPGGKLAVRERDGFRFDIGPSLLTMPFVFDEVLQLAGTSLASELALVRLDPQFTYHWADGSRLTVHDDAGATSAAFDGLVPGAGERWRRFDAHGRRIWEVSERTFFAGPMDTPLRLARRMRGPQDLVAIDSLRSLDRAARGTFGDPRLVQWADRYATYSGSSPYRAPATLACIPHIERRYGTWHPLGGLGALRDALVRATSAAGAALRCGVEVAAIETAGDAVCGVRTTDGRRLAADVVVANVDAGHLYADLLPDEAARRRVQRAEPSSSGFVVLVGADGGTAGITHHTIWFSPDYPREFRQLFDERVPADEPTIYACVSAVTDASQAPGGAENWFLLVNAPAGGPTDWEAVRDAYTERVLDLLAARGVDLRPRARFVESLTPADLAARYRTPGGSIYGTSSNGRRAAFVRPANRGARRGLYLVGGSSHPGGGLPLVAMSARIVAGMVAEDGW